MKKCNCNNYPAVWNYKEKGWQCCNCDKVNKCNIKAKEGSPCCPEYPHKRSFQDSLIKKGDIIIDEVSVMTDEMYRRNKKFKPLLKDCIFYQFKNMKKITTNGKIFLKI